MNHHTNGPWFTEDDSDQELPRWLVIDSSDSTVAICTGRHAKANATAIAQVPQLLAAAELLIDANSPQEIIAAENFGRNALNKARGKNG